MTSTRTMRRKVQDCVIPKLGSIRRVSSKADYKAYCKLYLQGFGYALERRLALWLLKRQIYRRSYVWEHEGQYKGIFALIEDERRRVTPDVRFRILCNVVIAKNSRGQGLSKHLIYAALDIAHTLGYDELILDVAVDNHPAISLYTSLGFEFIDSLS